MPWRTLTPRSGPTPRSGLDAPPATRQRADDEDDIETIRELRTKSRLDSSQASTDIMKLHAAAAAPAGGPIDAVALDSAKKRKVFFAPSRNWCIKVHQVETDAPRYAARRRSTQSSQSAPPHTTFVSSKITDTTSSCRTSSASATQSRFAMSRLSHLMRLTRLTLRGRQVRISDDY